MIFLNVILILFLFIIVYQDFRYQAVSWIFFPAGFVLTFLISVKIAGYADILSNLLMNNLFIFFQLGVIFLYFRIRFKNTLNIFKNVIGIGDILFLIMISPLFSIINFIFFFIVSLLFTLIVFIVLKALKIYKNSRVPLAGLQSLFLIIVLVIQIFSKFNLLNDFEFIDRIIYSL